MKKKRLFQELESLRIEYIELLDPKRDIDHCSGLASDYFGLMHMIANLLKTSAKSMEGLYAQPETGPSEMEHTIADVIFLVIKLLPYNEMLFLDKTLALLDEANQAILPPTDDTNIKEQKKKRDKTGQRLN